MSGQETDSPTAHGLNPNFKLLIIIITGVLIALVVFAIGKSIWDEHQAAVDKEQVEIQEAQQQAEMAQQQQAAEETANLKRVFGSQLTKLRSLEDQIYDVKAEIALAVNCQRGVLDVDNRCADYVQRLPDNQKKLKEIVDDYNAIALLIPEEVLEDLPPKFDDNGNALESS